MQWKMLPLAAAPLMLALGATAHGALIQTTDIVAIPQNVTGSGNGTLDLRLFTSSGSEITNASGPFNGDNGNNAVAQGGGGDSGAFAESYVTTAGDLKAYYNLNFTPGTINQIMLILDLNETGGGDDTNTLAKLDIVLNPTTINGNPNPSGDVTSAQQAAINQTYTGGTVIASLDPQPAANLPVISQGAGFADYAIYTGVNPFSLNDTDVLLFNVTMSALSNGGEEIFLDGTHAPQDIPEPAALGLLVLGKLLILTRRRRH